MQNTESESNQVVPVIEQAKESVKSFMNESNSISMGMELGENGGT